MNSYINLFGRTIHLYGILCALGIIFSLIILYLLAKKQKFEFFDFSFVVLITLISALIGSKLMFILVSMETVIEIFKTYPFFTALTSILQGGFVFYGGFIGGVIGLFVLTRFRKESLFKYSNLFALVLPLGHAFGRVGCFFAGCCYGMRHAGLFSYTYSNALDTSTPIGVPLLAVQLIEAVCLFTLFISLMIIYIKLPEKRNLITWFYLIAYAIIRFILEFFRGDLERGLFLNLSTSQWVSLIIIGITLYYYIVNYFRMKQKK